MNSELERVEIERAIASDYDFQSLVIALVVNDGFRYASAEVGE